MARAGGHQGPATATPLLPADGATSSSSQRHRLKFSRDTVQLIDHRIHGVRAEQGPGGQPHLTEPCARSCETCPPSPMTCSSAVTATAVAVATSSAASGAVT